MVNCDLISVTIVSFTVTAKITMKIIVTAT